MEHHSNRPTSAKTVNWTPEGTKLLSEVTALVEMLDEVFEHSRARRTPAATNSNCPSDAMPGRTEEYRAPNKPSESSAQVLDAQTMMSRRVLRSEFARSIPQTSHPSPESSTKQKYLKTGRNSSVWSAFFNIKNRVDNILKTHNT